MHAETGLTALDVTAAAWEHNMAIGFGDTGSVGIGGITLGGGVGYAARKYGLTIDNLLEAEIVLADGIRSHRQRVQSPRPLLGRSAAVAATSASSRGSSTSCTTFRRSLVGC